MEDKLKSSISKYKEQLRHIHEQHRRTRPLPQGLREIPSQDGKRMKLVSDNTTEPQQEDGDERVYVQYPLGPGGTVVHARSLPPLTEGIYLNDQIVNISVKLAYTKHVPEQRRTGIRVCDSFTYAELARGITSPEAAEVTMLANYQRVAGYRRAVQFGQPEVTIMPIAENQHWLLVACFINSTPNGNQAHLVVMDSLPTQPRWQILDVLSGFLRHQMGEVTTSRESWEVVRQVNQYDCGLHTIDNAERVLKYLGHCDNIDTIELQCQLVHPPGVVARATIRDTLARVAEGNWDAEPPPLTTDEPPNLYSILAEMTIVEASHEQPITMLNTTPPMPTRSKSRTSSTSSTSSASSTSSSNSSSSISKNKTTRIPPEAEAELSPGLFAKNNSKKLWEVGPKEKKHIERVAKDTREKHGRKRFGIKVAGDNNFMGRYTTRAVRKSAA